MTTSPSQKGTAIVTGAASGIGREIALRLAVDGFNIVANDLPFNSDKLETLVEQLQQTRVRAVAVTGDVSEEADVISLVQTAVTQLGGIDVMVANAGVELRKTLDHTTVEEWDRLFSINVRGVFLCYKYAAREMVKQDRGGRIIGACSIAGKKGVAQGGAYCGSKFAVRGLTQTAAQEYGKHGITVNAYAPGIIETDLLRRLDLVHGAEEGLEPGVWTQKVRDNCALKRNGQPNDVASVVSFLASEDSKFITGQSIPVDGGLIFD